jgi:hypothetical protein
LNDEVGKSYGKAVERTAAETGPPVDKFPEACPFSIDRPLSKSLIDGIQ